MSALRKPCVKIDPHGDPRDFTDCPSAIWVIEELQAQLDLPDFTDEARLKAAMSAAGLLRARRGTVVRALLALAQRLDWTREALGRAIAKSDCDSIYDSGGGYATVAISEVRKALQGTGITITTVWGHGYSISATHQRMLRSWIADKLEGAP